MYVAMRGPFGGGGPAGGLGFVRVILLREGRHWLSNPASNCHLDGQVRSARAPNFIRALAGVSEVQALRIVQPTNIQPLMRMDRLSRFLLERVAKELAACAGAKGGQIARRCAVVPSLTLANVEAAWLGA